MTKDETNVAVAEWPLDRRRTGRRRKTRERLQRALTQAWLDEMTAGIAHEVNNPLGSILLHSELMLARDTSPELRRDLRIIHNEAKRAARTITGLLMCGQRGPSRRTRIDLHQVLEDVVAERRHTQATKDIRIAARFADDPLFVRGDASRLTQAFANVMANAEEALAEADDRRIRITTGARQGWAKVAIADSGTGIPEENLRRVFYPFFTTKRGGGGSGLGLSAAHSIVTDHQGLIRAGNNEMGGATLTLELPLWRPPKPRRRSPEE